jgi:hypothetical protein
MQSWLISQLAEHGNTLIFQQDREQLLILTGCSRIPEFHAAKLLDYERRSCIWSGLVVLLISRHVTPFCEVMQSKKCLCHLYRWVLMDWSWKLPKLLRQFTGICQKEYGMSWAFVGHVWSPCWTTLGYVKLPEFVIQMTLATIV